MSNSTDNCTYCDKFYTVDTVPEYINRLFIEKFMCSKYINGYQHRLHVNECTVDIDYCPWCGKELK